MIGPQEREIGSYLSAMSEGHFQIASIEQQLFLEYLDNFTNLPAACTVAQNAENLCCKKEIT